LWYVVCSKERTIKFSTNISADAGRRLRTTAFEQNVSSSAICEIALKSLFTSMPQDRLANYLRKRGACLRRKAKPV
jgi:hypothetical protein